MYSCTVLGHVYEVRVGGITSRWHPKGRLVRKGGCELVLQGRMHSGGSGSMELMKGIYKPTEAWQGPKACSECYNVLHFHMLTLPFPSGQYLT